MGRGDSSGKNPLSDNGKDVEGDKARVWWTVQELTYAASRYNINFQIVVCLYKQTNKHEV